MTGQDRLFFADIGEEQTLFDLEPEAAGEVRPLGRCVACDAEMTCFASPRICARCFGAGHFPGVLFPN